MALETEPLQLCEDCVQSHSGQSVSLSQATDDPSHGCTLIGTFPHLVNDSLNQLISILFFDLS